MASTEREDALETPLLRKYNPTTGFTNLLTRNDSKLSVNHHLASLISLRSLGSENYDNKFNEIVANLETLNQEKFNQSTAIFQSTSLPKCTKILIPILIIANIALFITANTHTGASVLLNVDVMGYEFYPDTLFNFSLVNSIEDMYRAEAYALSALVFVWSGTWPYLKLVLLLFCWFAKPSFLSIKVRGVILEVMDFLGKWCMIDAFLMVIMSVAFRFDIMYPHETHVFLLNVVVTNEVGLYCFVSATILTLILSHVVLVYHKNAQNLQLSEEKILLEAHMERKTFLCPCPKGSWFDVGSLEPNDTADKRMSLLRYTGGIRPYFREVNFRHKLRILAFNIFIFVALVGSLLLLIIGAQTKSFSFEYTGLLGDMVKVFAPEKKKQSYSLLSIGYALTNNVNPDLTVDGSHLYKLDDNQLFGLYWVQAVYLSFALFFPVVLVIFLSAVWFIPMTLRDQKIVFYCIQINSSWSAIEVYLVSLIATNLEISQFAKFLLEVPCTEIEFLFKTECFSVDTEFYTGIYYLIVAMILLLVTNHIILFYSSRAIEFRESLAIIEIKEKYGNS